VKKAEGASWGRFLTCYYILVIYTMSILHQHKWNESEPMQNRDSIIFMLNQNM